MLTQTGLASQFFLRITLNKPGDSYFGKKSWFMSNTTTSTLQPNDLGPACAHGASAARPRVGSALQGLRKGKDGAAGINQDGGRPVQQAMGRRPEGAQLDLLGTPRLQSELPGLTRSQEHPSSVPQAAGPSRNSSGVTGSASIPELNGPWHGRGSTQVVLATAPRVPIEPGDSMAHHAWSRAVRGCRDRLLRTGHHQSHGWAKRAFSPCLSFLIY